MMKPMTTNEPAFRGVWCASVTPLREDLSIDVDRLERHLGRLLADGCDGVALFGSTGEGNSFSVRERAACILDLSARGLPMDRVLVGAGACAVPDAVFLARAAREAGAAGVMMHPPFYYRDASDDGLFAFFSAFVHRMGSEPIPVVLYHFPGLIGVGFGPELVARLVAHRPDVFAGLKDSSGDLERMAAIAAGHPGFSVLAGTERLLLPLIERGGAGCLTATANLTSALAQTVYSTRRPEDQVRLSAARRALETAPFVPGLKQLIADREGDAGWTRVRPPLDAVPPDAMDRLRAAVTAAPHDVSA
jgi:4-hydroxy-tetrahydrodipicolinate synthase